MKNVKPRLWQRVIEVAGKSNAEAFAKGEMTKNNFYALLYNSGVGGDFRSTVRTLGTEETRRRLRRAIG